MITATFSFNGERQECSLRLKGHAGQAEVGKDIVCASASILAYTLAHCIKNMWELGSLACEPNIVLDEGDAAIECKCEDDELFAEAFQTYSVIKVGYSLLAHNYPQYVELITDDLSQ